MDSPAQRDNRVLSRAWFLTSLGDWLSYFALLTFIHRSTGDVLLAAYTVPLRSLAAAVGGLCVPAVLSRFDLGRLLVATQALSAGLLLAIAAVVFATPAGYPYLILGLLFVNSALKLIFDAARETYSKHRADETPNASQEHRTFQAELLSGFFGAQMVGPVAAFVLLQFLPVEVLLLADAVTFLVTAASCRVLQPLRVQTRLSILRPLGYLRTHVALRRIFLIRAVWFWIPTGIFNYVLFGLITEHFRAGIEFSALQYTLTGLGSFIAATALRRARTLGGFLVRTPDALVAAGALLLQGLARLVILLVPTFGGAAGAMVMSGVCNGANAVTTQSLRRKLADGSQFVEIVGLEIFVARVVDWLVGSAVAFAIASGVGSSMSFGYLAVILALPLALIHTDKHLRR